MSELELTHRFLRRTRDARAGQRGFPSGSRYNNDPERVIEFLFGDGVRPTDRQLFSGIDEWLFTTDREELEPWHMAVICLLCTELMVATDARPGAMPQIEHCVTCYLLAHAEFEPAESAALSALLLAVEEKRDEHSDFVGECMLFACVIDAMSGNRARALERARLVDKTSIYFGSPKATGTGWSYVLHVARVHQHPALQGLFDDVELVEEEEE
jgi:hypothetical protein